MDENKEYNPDIITVEDDEGKVHTFEVADKNGRCRRAHGAHRNIELFPRAVVVDARLFAQDLRFARRDLVLQRFPLAFESLILRLQIHEILLRVR